MRLRAVPTAAVLLLLALAGLGARGAGAGDEPPAPPPPASAEEPSVVLSEFTGDPAGEAARADRAAREMLDPAAAVPHAEARAAEIWMELAESGSRGLLPAPEEIAPVGQPAPTEGLWWPAREVALTRLAALSAEGRDAVERRWGAAAAQALDDGLRTHATEPLERAARLYPVTRAGSTALRLLAEIDLEAGRASTAAVLLDRWLRCHPSESRERRAAVAARLADALVVAEDERGVVLLSRRAHALGNAQVEAAGRTTTVADRIASALREVRARIAKKAEAEPAGPGLPANPVTLWTRPLTDPGLYAAEPVAPEALPTVAAAAADGLETLYVAEDRVVRRIDLATGMVRWTYPEERLLAREHAPRARYRPWEGPTRAVVPAGGLVLCVLGDPPMPATSMFLHRNVPVRSLESGREERTRLVALRPVDGSVAWVTGAPGETDPVLGAPDTAVVSPPLVDGDRAFVVLSARRGTVESWLACVDLATGKPRFVVMLGRGESGLVRSTDEERALFEPRVRSVPRAERPSLAAGEVCVVTGAGYAAGVRADDGALLWTRALPRYRYEDRDAVDPPPFARSFAASNVPLYGFGSWIVAAPDAPVLVSIEAGTGRLRWTAEPRPRPDSERIEGTPESPESQHLLSLAPGPDGLPLVRLAGEERALELRNAVSGTWRQLSSFPGWRTDDAIGDADPTRQGGLSRGRPHSEGRRVTASRGGMLRGAAWPAAVTSRAWQEDVERARPSDAEPLPTGDILRVGDLWVVVGASRLCAVASSTTASRLASAKPRDAFDAAGRACLAARRLGSPEALEKAAAAVRESRAIEADLVLSQAASALLLGPSGVLRSARPEKALDLLPSLDVLSPSRRASAYLEIARALVRRRRHAALVDLVDRWVPWGDRALLDVDSSGRVQVRSDLHAVATLLPLALGSPEGAQALAQRERRAEKELAAATTTSALEEIVLRRPATVAAWIARVRLVGIHFDAGAARPAAERAAEARLSGGTSVPAAPVTAAALRALEGDALARAGETQAAREALREALLVAPAMARAAEGDDATTLRDDLRTLTAFSPRSGDVESVLHLWPEGGAPSDGALATVSVLAPEGLGASPDLSIALVARGLDLEAWDLPAATRTPLPPADQGYLGVTLLDREPCVPAPGVRVGSVVPGSQADLSGLREGDWIVRFFEKDAVDRETVTRLAAEADEGTVAPVVVLRSGAVVELKIPIGRRTPRDRQPMVPAQAYVRADGTWIVPSRFGLRAIDPVTATSKPLWRWTGDGDVKGMSSFAGRVIVWTSKAPLQDGFVVVVDARSGKEAWRVAIPGRIAGPVRAVGSAVLVDAGDPDRTWFLDAEDGSVRGSYARAEGELVPMGTLPVPNPLASAVAAGCVHFLRENRGDGSLWLVSVDPATATPTWERRADLSSASTRLFPPILSAGSVVALALTDDDIQVYVPDLTGHTLTPEPLRIDYTQSDSVKWGMIENDSRLVVCGDFIHIMRTSRDRRASVATLEIDRDEVRRNGPHKSLLHQARAILIPSSETSGDGRRIVWPLVVAARATLEGIWASATYVDPGSGPAEGRVVWFEPEFFDKLHSFTTANTVLFTQPPVRVGRRALLPTDEGFLVVPLELVEPHTDR